MDCIIDSDSRRLLVLSRRAGESILIGNDIEVLVVALLPPTVRFKIVVRSAGDNAPYCSLVSCDANKHIRVRDRIELAVRQVRRREARLVILAPPTVRILRSELSGDRRVCDRDAPANGSKADFNECQHPSETGIPIGK
ncbi:carbon storage regulator [Povalibacter sp.]|uniref:carbon storage regulator n=1 Tax=Povalibacter sp. TaxID=1962978 RepID=UPI0039C985B3